MYVPRLVGGGDLKLVVITQKLIEIKTRFEAPIRCVTVISESYDTFTR